MERALSVLGVLRSIRQVQGAVGALRPLLVAGPCDRLETIYETLVAGGDGNALRVIPTPRDADLEDVSVLVVVAEETPTREQEQLLWQATRRSIGRVCVLVRNSDAPPVANVLAESVVTVNPGDLIPMDRLCERIAIEAGEAAYLLAERLPPLRSVVSEQIVQRFARRNGVLGVAILVPGADFPVLTLNEIRMVLRLAATHGQPITANSAVELAAVVVSGLALRSMARAVLTLFPGPSWFYKGGIAYSGTKAIGEAATSYFERGARETFQDVVRRRS